jgi:hypothetical protein
MNSTTDLYEHDGVVVMRVYDHDEPKFGLELMPDQADKLGTNLIALAARARRSIDER